MSNGRRRNNCIACGTPWEEAGIKPNKFQNFQYCPDCKKVKVKSHRKKMREAILKRDPDYYARAQRKYQLKIAQEEKDIEDNNNNR